MLKNLLWIPHTNNMAHSLPINIFRVLCEICICKFFANVKMIKMKLVDVATQGFKQSKKLIVQQ